MHTSHASLKTGFLLSCACVALMGGGSAHAEDAPDKGAISPANPEILVTAQRRNESIQNVPMTLQALTGDTLSKFNVVTFDDLLKYTPNVTYGSNGPGAGAIFMRGLSAGFVGNQSSATIAPFPNVALYLDDQSMQFPARNADVYLADMERVEVLEGPQGTLFGGGAEAGAVRYITNKPKLDKWEAKAEGSYGGTSHGAANSSFTAMLNAPVIDGTLAIRAVIYNERQGGYIDNVASTFTRSNIDGGNGYFSVPTVGGLCPNGKAPVNGCALPASQQSNGGQYNNYAIAGADSNPVTYQGGRIALEWQASPDWSLLISESMQDMDAQGSSAQEPVGLDFQTLGKLQTTIFTPSYNKDRYWNTAWTLNGKIDDFKVIYTGAYMTRHIEDQQDYTNYSRTAAGMYYQCVGGTTGWGSGLGYCYAPQSYWHDSVRNTHMSHELRISTPENKRFRVLGGAYYERFKIYDEMNFEYRTIPTCTSTLIGQGVDCSGVTTTAPGATTNAPLNPATQTALGDNNTAFGEDTQRGYDQYAFFGSADFDVTPKLTITGGTRYYNYKEYELGSQFETYDGPYANKASRPLDQHLTNCYEVTVCMVNPQAYMPVMLSNGLLVNTSGNININNNNDHVTYHGFKSRAVITWKPQPGTMIYGLFSQGFRPGGFNRGTKAILNDPADPYSKHGGPFQYLRPNDYAPDSLTNWELGVKTDLFNHKMQLNVSGYYMIWSNTQLGFYNPAAGFGNTSFVTNGPNYHVKGFEVQVVARPITGLTMQGALSYNDSKQTNSPCFVPNIPGSSTYGNPCVQNVATSSGVQQLFDPFGTVGGTLPFSPKVQADLRVRYEWEMKGLKWFTTGSMAYTGPMYSEPNTYPSADTAPAACGGGTFGTTQCRYHQAGYALFDASAGIAKDGWSATLFVKNLGDSNASTFTSSPQYIQAQVPVRPRTYGLRVSVSY